MRNRGILHSVYWTRTACHRPSVIDIKKKCLRLIKLPHVAARVKCQRNPCARKDIVTTEQTNKCLLFSPTMHQHQIELIHVMRHNHSTAQQCQLRVHNWRTHTQYASTPSIAKSLYEGRGISAMRKSWFIACNITLDRMCPPDRQHAAFDGTCAKSNPVRALRMREVTYAPNHQNRFYKNTTESP